MGHLVSDVLEPRLQTLRARDHGGHFAADDSELVEGLASERFPLRRPPTKKPRLANSFRGQKYPDDRT